MQIRNYNHDADFEAVGDFLIQAYRHTHQLQTWLQPRWEYMHYHTMILELDRSQFGVAEENGKIWGIVHFEGNPAEVFIQAHPDHPELKGLLLDHAEHNGFEGMSTREDRPFRMVYVNDFDTELGALVQARGYQKWNHFEQPMAVYTPEKPVPEVKLPDGFRVQSLADENDLHKINQVLWRGFNHPGAPPEEEVVGRAFAQQAPNFRKDLTIVTVTPGGRYVSFCGMWYIPENKVAYLEPLATDPDYRRMGMARAAVYESIRRVRALGARDVFVGSGQEFYQRLGFEVKYTAYPWVLYLD
jgi:predicted N-acetyltransferase YhbS